MNFYLELRVTIYNIVDETIPSQGISLVHTIPASELIIGVTTSDEELFVLNYSRQVIVYDRNEFKQQRVLKCRLQSEKWGQ